MTKETEKVIRMGIIVVSATMVLVGSFVCAFSFQAMKNSKRITDAQVEQIKKINEQIGKPQVIEQRYITVKENK